ncbi:Signaling protein YkoW [Apiospora marii]|uniref:Signaling protein YkoW n=1 Tax=Apiospora marii TaxID=335849 RepID=A0ABR1RJW8_9PEZI
MQIKAQNVDSKLMDMAAFAEEKTMMEPGVHMGFFGVQARMSEEPMELWQFDLIRQLDGLRVTTLCSNLKESKRVSPALSLFACKVSKSIEALRALVRNPIFDEATLTARVVQVPCRAPFGSSSANSCTMISLRVVIPIHVNVLSPHCDLMPLYLAAPNMQPYESLAWR